MFQLNIIDAGGRKWQYRLSRNSICTIGRAAANTIPLDDPRVSRFHAHIKYEDGAFVLVDGAVTNGEIRRSATGVFINSERVFEHRLNSGDEITMGASSFQFLERVEEWAGTTVILDQVGGSDLDDSATSFQADEEDSDDLASRPGSAEFTESQSEEGETTLISLDSVTFDETGFSYQGDGDHFRVWSSPAGDQVGLFLYSIPPDITARIDNPDELRKFYRSLVETAGLGIIEVECRQVAGCEAVRTIFKAPQVPAGRTYLGSLTIPFAGFSFVLKVECAEVGTTGMRDTMVLMQFMSTNEAGSDAGTSWVQDPYDSTQVSAMTMNQSERAEYDSMFPEHPLSRLRQVLAHLEQTVQLSQEVKESARFVA